MWFLLPMKVINGILKVLMFGAKTYGAFNWREVEPYRVRYVSALFRHLFDRYWKKELFDPETGQLHMFHAGCCLFFLADKDIRDAERLGLNPKNNSWHDDVDLFKEDISDFKFEFMMPEENDG